MKHLSQEPPAGWRKVPDQLNDIDAAAATWAALAHGGFSSPQDERACRAWIEADARHMGAFARAIAVLEVVREARDQAQAPNETLPPFEDVELCRGMGRRYLLGGLAALIVGAVAIPNLDQDAQAAVYLTERGQQRTIALEDGIALTLNTQTRLTMGTRRNLRKLQLDRGEIALVVPGSGTQVSLDFSGVEVMPRGAEVAVSSLSPGIADLTVVSGSVRLRAGDDRFTIGAGRHVRFESGRIAEVEMLSGEDMRARLAWREGMFDFSDVTLAEAARRFARYNSVEIVPADAEVANQRITGVFSLGRPRQFADAVAEALDLRARHEDAHVILQKK